MRTKPKTITANYFQGRFQASAGGSNYNEHEVPYFATFCHQISKRSKMHTLSPKFIRTSSPIYFFYIVMLIIEKKIQLFIYRKIQIVNAETVYSKKITNGHNIFHKNTINGHWKINPKCSIGNLQTPLFCTIPEMMKIKHSWKFLISLLTSLLPYFPFKAFWCTGHMYMKTD